MNAPENINTLRAEIGQYLARVGEATAKDVAEAVLHEKLDVTRAMNEMLRDAEVEREKKRGEYVYWLVADAKVPVSKAEKKKAPAEIQATSAQMQVTSVEMQVTSGVCNKCLGSGFLPKAMIFPEPPDVKCPNGCKPPIDFTAPELNYLAPEDYELPPADPEMLALANREMHRRVKELEAERDRLLGKTPESLAAEEREEFTFLSVIADIRDAIGDTGGRIMLGDLAQQIKKDYALLYASIQQEKLWEQSMQEAIGEDGPSSVVLGILSLRNERDELRTRLDELNQQWQSDTGRLTADLRAALESRSQVINESDRLRAELSGKERTHKMLMEQRDLSSLLNVAGYLVRAPKRKPRVFKEQWRAVDDAMMAARGKFGRGDVFALVPVGVARKGAEWSDA